MPVCRLKGVGRSDHRWIANRRAKGKKGYENQVGNDGKNGKKEREKQKKNKKEKEEEEVWGNVLSLEVFSAKILKWLIEGSK